MEVIPEISKELKQVELEMLRQFVRICDELNLRYYVLGGTLLGAVRHQGFIPWDDDIDVGMPRKDYEVFLQKGQTLLSEPYFLQTFQTDPEFPANFAKIRNSETTFIESSIRNCKVNHGVYIDVFPLDYYPDNQWSAHLVELKKRIYSGRISNVFCLKEKPSIKSRLFRCACRLIVPSVRRAVEQRDKLYKRYTDGKRIVNYGGAWGKKEIIPAAWYGEGCELEFEGIRVNAPVDYDSWLTQVYGDYMQLPPIEKRVGHHDADVIDLHCTYKKYCG